MIHTDPPLILLPGLMCDEAVWQPLYPFLPPSHPIQVMDYDDATSMQDMAERTLAAAPARFAMAGHSMGGRVALEVMRRAPERVVRVALLDTGMFARPAGDAGEQEAQKRFALLNMAREQGVRSMAQTWVQGMVHPGRLTDHTLIEAVVSMFERKSADRFAHQIQALLARPAADDVMRQLQVPTMVLCGAQDAWSPPSQHAAMVALCPHAWLEVVDDAGHMAPMERPRAVAAALVRWLART